MTMPGGLRAREVDTTPFLAAIRLSDRGRLLDGDDTMRRWRRAIYIITAASRGGRLRGDAVR